MASSKSNRAAARRSTRAARISTSQFAYERLGPRYRGTISIQPLNLQVEDSDVTPFGVDMAVTVEKNRIARDLGELSTGGSTVELSGALDDLTSPRASFQYDARVSLADVARMFHAPELRRGDVQVGGSGSFSGSAGLAATGNVRASGVEYRDSIMLLRNGRSKAPRRSDRMEST